MNKTEHFIEKATKIHNNIYDYSNVVYKTVDEKVEIICPIHGIFFQSPRIHLYKNGGCNACAIDRSKKTNTKTTNQFVQNAIKHHGTKYDYTNVNYVNATTPVEIICPIHGSFFQLPSSHTRGHGCKKCAVRKNTDWFLTRAEQVHGTDYNYPNIQYITGKHKIDITCPTHGTFSQIAESHLAGTGCPTCGMENHSFSSTAEQKITKMIEDLGFEVITNIRSILFPREVDIYIPEKNIAIEYDGIFWHSELCGKDRYYHAKKTEDCKAINIELIHIFESEWVAKQELVLSRIRTKLGKSERVFARKCSISVVDSKTAHTFFETNHIQGACNASLSLALEYDNKIIAAMSFGRSRFTKQAEWELLRYCSRQNVVVVGGASKLFNHALKIINPVSVISYSDKRWNTGELYKQLGFLHSHDSRPNYFYFSNTKTTDLLSRQKFQKHKLPKMLDTYDPTLTEWENMKINGYNRIWDCGNSVWVWTRD